MTNAEIINTIKLSDKFKEIVKKEFKGINCRLELIINQGGIRDSNITLKIN